MANLPEKNVVLVDKITNVPTDSNLFINANGEFKQASVNDVVNSSTVVSTAVETAINTAVQDSIDSNFKQTSGSPILLTDSADGTLINFKGKGRSTQTQYSGKNLANVKDKTSGTAEGITSSIANEVVTASGTSTGNGDISISLSTNIVMESGTDYTISIQEITGTMPSYFTVYLHDDSTGIFSNYDTMSTSNLSVVFNLTDTIECSVVLFRINTNDTINGTFRLQIEKGTTKTDYEPYVGGTASPNPEYPQAIKSVADGGWFDGELLQGTYQSTTGTYASNYNFVVCSKNKIPCKAGDVIKIDFKKGDCTSSIRYWNNGTYVAYEDNKESYIVPSGVNEFAIIIQDTTSSPIAPSTVGHICVTINGKYALIVKSKGKNLLKNIATSRTINGVTFTINDDGSVTVKGTLTEVSAEIALTNYIPLEDNTKYILSGCPDGGSEDKFYARIWTNNAYKKLATDIGNSTTFVTNFSEHINYIAYICVIGLGVSYDTTFYPMLRRAEIIDDTYEPYKETVSYIPLNEPLRGVDSVSDVVSLTEVTRRFTEVVFDGSDDEQWLPSGICFYINLYDTKVDAIGYCKASSTHFKNHNEWLDIYSGKIDNTFTLYKNEEWVNSRLAFYCSNITTVDEWKTWLQANPIKVIYELAEPITETIEPVDIVTYDNVTYLTASDNADMEIEYPTTKVAGIASIGYSKGIKAEYETEQLKKQLLEIQATIVNTL